MFVNRRTIRIEWGDCDPAGIVFFPRYFAYFDACTMSLFEAAGFPKQDLFRDYDFAGFPMVDTSARFLIPSRFGDDVVFESCVTAWGRSSFKVRHQVLRPEGLAVEGHETRVWTGRDPDGSLKSRATPDEIVSRFLTPEERAAARSPA
jgi:4-hydroxybenzoyl-CoA thioesterase